MDRELTKDEIQAQIDEKTRDLNARVDTLKHEAGFASHVARDRVEDLKEQTGTTALIAGGGALAIGLLFKLLSGDDEDRPANVRRRVLTPSYLDALALDVEGRIGQGDDLAEALGHALGRRAPLLLQTVDGRGGSWGTRLLGLGLLAAAGVGLHYASQAFFGRSLLDLARTRLEGYLEASAQDEGDQHADLPVHRTTGAEMPAPPLHRPA